MKSLLITLCVLAALTTFVSAADSKSSKKKPAEAPKQTGPVRELTLEETDALIKKNPGIAILDVRMAEELQNTGHLKGAKNVDFTAENFEKSVEALNLDKSKTCIVYCAIGGRAKRAAEKMIGMGFKDIVMPRGGFNAWKAAGKPVEGGKS